MTVAIGIWINEIQIRLPGAIAGVIDMETKAALREFYTDSGLWVETLENLGTTAGVEDLNLSVAAVTAGYDANVIIVSSIKYDGSYLTAQHHLDRTPSSEVPTQYYGTSSGNVILINTPVNTVANIMDAEVILTPAFTTDVVPDDASAVWFDVILDGVLGRIHSQPNKPYTNLVSSQYHLRRFRQGIGTARDVARRRYTKTENSWTFPAWA